MKIEKHWLTEANKIPSPNYDDRPEDQDISLLVVHCISLPPEQFTGNYIDQLFCNQLNPQHHPYFEQIYQLRVSAHLLIRRDGSINQYVAFNKRAWHAGVSEYKGQQRCNDFAIGVELEGSENQPYTKAQYSKLISVTQCLIQHYPELSSQHIAGHSDIAPGRKTDPGKSFDWKRYLSALSQTNNSAQ